MQRFRFAFVSNSAEIGASLASCADPRTEEVLLNYATMEKAIPVARRLLADGIDVIIGGGGTGGLLAERIGMPIINLERNPLDLLHALLRARRNTKAAAVTSYARPLVGLDFYEQLLAMRLHPIVFSSSAELKLGIERVVRDGQRVIVGGGICSQIARDCRATGVVVVPRKENILRALSSARAVAKAQRSQGGSNDMASPAGDAMILVDDRGHVGVVNECAAVLLRTILPDHNPAVLLGQPLPRELSAIGVTAALTSGRVQDERLCALGGVDCSVVAIPLMVDGRTAGAALTIREARLRPTDKVRRNHVAKGFVARYRFNDIVGGACMSALVAKAHRYSASDAAVLIEGETGAGKELFAQSIHNASSRNQHAFVAVNCSALPESLLESELFGYEEGAFTGARRGGKAGLFELAANGTLFLDEIADISPKLQVRLLRALEEKEIMRLGGDRNIPLDVRIITSSQRDLFAATQLGSFRLDLYFRLATLRLKLPPLRERPEDVPLLLRSLLAKHDISFGDLPRLAGVLREYAWPGNVRELDALARTYAALAGRQRFDQALFLEMFREIRFEREIHRQPEALAGDNGGALKEQIRRHERLVIQRTLEQCRFNRIETARRLGISVNSLWRKMSQTPR